MVKKMYIDRILQVRISVRLSSEFIFTGQNYFFQLAINSVTYSAVIAVTLNISTTS